MPDALAAVAACLRPEAGLLDAADGPARFIWSRWGGSERMPVEQPLRHRTDGVEDPTPPADGDAAPARLTRVYVAGPYTHGDVAANVAAALRAADELIEAGFAPFVPHLSHFQHMAHPRPYRVWTALDFAWLAVCAAAVRLPGDSTGADAEVQWCRTHGIPVFPSVRALVGRLGRRAAP